MNLKRMNDNGLTFIQWMCAAGKEHLHVWQLTQMYVDAWSVGEDPTDWRAYHIDVAQPTAKDKVG